MDPKEGLALSILVRLVATSVELDDGSVRFKTYKDRIDPLPSTFTKEMIEHIVRPFSYIRFRIRTSAFILNDEHVLELIQGMNQGDAERWYSTHVDYIKDVGAELDKLVAGNGSLGFRCVG